MSFRYLLRKYVVLPLVPGALALTAGCATLLPLDDTETDRAIAGLLRGADEGTGIRLEHIGLPGANREVPALRLRPAGCARAGLVLVPGMNPRGAEHEQNLRFLRTLARAGFLVLVPDFPEYRRLEMSTAAVEDTTRAWLALRAELSPDVPVGLAGVSVGAGTALVAASDPRIRDRVAFAFTIGAFHDMAEVGRYYNTGRIDDRDDEATQPRRLQRLPAQRWFIALLAVDALADQASARKLRGYALQRMYGGLRAKRLAPPELSPPARAVYDFVMNRDPQRYDALYAAMPASVRAKIEALNPASHPLERIRAPVVLIHGERDPVFPVIESRRIAARIPGARLVAIDGIRHVAFRVRPGVLAGYRRAVDAILALRGPPCTAPPEKAHETQEATLVNTAY